VIVQNLERNAGIRRKTLMTFTRLSELVWPYFVAALLCGLPVVVGLYLRYAHLEEFGDASDWSYLVSGCELSVYLSLTTLILLGIGTANFLRKRRQGTHHDIAG
jgi:hypothetical protein